jgi:NADH-quinone oxidoreductase subunit G
MSERPLKAYLLLAVEPGLDCTHPAATSAALAQAEHVVALASFAGAELKRLAHAILPIGAFTETEGTFVNAAGDWRSFAAAVPAYAESRPGWKVLRVLGNRLGLDGFEFPNAEAVLAEMKGVLSTSEFAPGAGRCPVRLGAMPGELYRVGEVPIYAVDALVRRAGSLQRTADAPPLAVRINGRQAARLAFDGETMAQVSQGGASICLPLQIDERVPDGAAWLPAGVPGTEQLGSAFGLIELAVA